MSGARLWTGRILLGLFSLFMAMDTAMHVLRPPFAVEATRKAGVDPSILLPIGLLEIVFLVLLVTPRFRVLGALFFTAFFGGATAVHVIGQSSYAMAVMMAFVLWAGVVCLTPAAGRALGLEAEAGADPEGLPDGAAHV